MDLQRARDFLRSIGFTAIAGITFDFAFNQEAGLTGTALLTDGRQVRFVLPDDPAATPVVNVFTEV